MTVQRPHELARRSGPHFDGTISRGRDDVLIVEIDNIDCGSMTDQNSTEVDFSGANHIPNGDAPILNFKKYIYLKKMQEKKE